MLFIKSTKATFPSKGRLYLAALCHVPLKSSPSQGTQVAIPSSRRFLCGSSIKVSSLTSKPTINGPKTKRSSCIALSLSHLNVSHLFE
jgi:hypothetical protein